MNMALLAALLWLAIPLNDLGNGMYLGFPGGLYENGTNVAPSDHLAAGLAHAARVRPLDANGNPSPNGKIVMISVGMSNTTQEFCAAGNPAPCNAWSFIGQAAADPAVNHSTLVLVNGASGGQDAKTWDSPSAANWDHVRVNDLEPLGLTEKQVQIAWIKQADAGPTASLPSPNADAWHLESELGKIVRALKVRYPNIRLAYVTSRIYAGYASTTLNPEPYAYESGFAVKWLVQAQIDQRRRGAIDPKAGDLNDESAAPWIGWGPYPWADGMNARSDGLTWSRSDLVSDGTHPSQSGQQKVGAMLLAFFRSDPTARSWFLSSPPPSRRRAAEH